MLLVLVLILLAIYAKTVRVLNSCSSKNLWFLYCFDQDLLLVIEDRVYRVNTNKVFMLGF